MARHGARRSIMVFVVLGPILMGCAAMQCPAPTELQAPRPIEGNDGKYMCPYTSDGVVAEWVDKAINARAGAAIGRIGGAYAGQKAMEQVPFLGGWLGQAVGDKVGREVAIKASGGWKFIKKTSDLSFNSVDNMCVYLYVKYSTNEHYQKVLKATYSIYPEMQRRFYAAIQRAPRKR